MSHPKTILITDANRGIGYFILQALAISSPYSRLILAARNPSDGQAALTQLRHDLPPSTSSETDISVLTLDVTNTSSINSAQTEVAERYGRLDILINNAGIAIPESVDASNIESSYAQTFATNVTGVAMIMSAFLPLMKTTSPSPRIINISSARASLHRSSTGGLTPSSVISYLVSKTALNALTLEYARADPEVAFYAASPGYCMTAFNGYQGTKDPLEGAKAVAELTLAKGGKYGSRFWEMEEEGQACPVPW